MAGRSLLSRVLSTPVAQVFCSSGLGSTTQLPFPSLSSKGEHANDSAARPPSRLSRSSSFACHRTTRQPVSVCRINLDVGVEAARSASLETTRADLQGYFETQAAVGRVECNNRGCRPIFYHESVEKATRPNTQFAKEFAEFLHDVRTERGAAQKYFEVAVEANPSFFLSTISPNFPIYPNN